MMVLSVHNSFIILGKFISPFSTQMHDAGTDFINKKDLNIIRTMLTEQNSLENRTVAHISCSQFQWNSVLKNVFRLGIFLVA
jgi:hypothetical protein